MLLADHGVPVEDDYLLLPVLQKAAGKSTQAASESSSRGLEKARPESADSTRRGRQNLRLPVSYLSAENGRSYCCELL
jgi:hypothetical protein